MSRGALIALAIIIIVLIILGVLYVFKFKGTTGGEGGTQTPQTSTSGEASFQCNAKWARPGFSVLTLGNMLIVLNVSGNTATVLEMGTLDLLYQLKLKGVEIPDNVTANYGIGIYKYIDNPQVMQVVADIARSNGEIKQVSLDEGYSVLLPRGDIQKCGDHAIYTGSFGLAHVTTTFKYKGVEKMPRPSLEPEYWPYHNADVAVLYGVVKIPQTGANITLYTYIDPHYDILVGVGVEQGGLLTVTPETYAYHIFTQQSLSILLQSLEK